MRKALFVGFLLLTIFSFCFGTSLGNLKRRTVPALDPTWAKLDGGRKYRDNWRGFEQPHSRLISRYTSDIPEDIYTQTPQDLFLEAANEFRTVLETSVDPDELEQAEWGLQEALNEFMTGQLLIGNDVLVQGLRVRFPVEGDMDDPDQLTLLSLSEQKFQAGIDQTIEDLRNNPPSIRQKGTINSRFPIFVQNSASADSSGDVVENELYQFINLVERKAMASNSKAKRMFFFGNVDDVDNFPYNNFPGKEDLDFNRDRILNQGERVDAAKQLKRSAHTTYIQTALLTAIQSPEDFESNNGYQLKQHVKDAQIIFEDIQSGSNPLNLLGDFIPFQNIENFINIANTRVADAISTETAAKNAARTYDQDQTSLTQTLQSQQELYLDRIQQLTGVDLDGIDLMDPVDRNTFYSNALTKLSEGKGEMGIQKLMIEEAMLSAERVEEMVKQIPQKIHEENERNKSIAKLITNHGEEMSALSVSESIASSVSVSFSPSDIYLSNVISGTGCRGNLTCSPTYAQAVGRFGSNSANISYNPKAQELSLLRAEKDLLNALQQVEIGNVNSDATIRQLMYEQALNVIAFKAAKKSVEREEARLEEMQALLERTIRNYISARTDMSEYYFMNPAYRLEKDQLAEAAETSFETAMTNVYYVAKTLEYLWSEKFNNPIPSLHGGLPISLPSSYDPYIRAESVFSAKFAHQISPNLKDYMSALQEWDKQMRQNRFPNSQTGYVYLSMRKDILGFDNTDENYNKLLFKNFIAEHRVKGLNPVNDDLLFEFGLQIGDEQLFASYPNLKIKDISINLVSDVNRSIRGGQSAGAAKIDLVMMDEVNIRTFFADYPTDDDVLTLTLESSRNLDKSPFIANVEAKIDNYSQPEATVNTQLSDHSPACNRWVLRMKMNQPGNRELLLEHLEDIEIVMQYQYGKPRDVGF